MPTESEIAALLALPDEAREALKGCEGPGWSVALIVTAGEHAEVMAALTPILCERPSPAAHSMFLPCSPLEIVKVAAEKAGHHRYLLCRDECERDGVWFVAECGYCDKSQEAGSPHLAALALLAEVWR